MQKMNKDGIAEWSKELITLTVFIIKSVSIMVIGAGFLSHYLIFVKPFFFYQFIFQFWVVLNIINQLTPQNLMKFVIT
jgi:hypothetical protein